MIHFATTPVSFARLVVLVLATLLQGCENRENAPAVVAKKHGGAAEDQPSDSLGEIPTESPTEQWARLDDPARDGWLSEAMAAEARHQLEELAALILAKSPLTREDLASFLSPESTHSSDLVPPSLRVVYRSSGATVERPAGQAPAARQDFAKALNALAADFAFAHQKSASFKIIELDARPGTTGENLFQSRQHVTFAGLSGKQALEHHAVWLTTWERPEGIQKPLLISITLESFERTTSPSGTWFKDCSDSVLAGNASYHEQLMRGMNHWLERIPYRAALNRMGTPGLALGDVNGDGLDDLYICQEPGLPNRLFLQQADGSTIEDSAGWGVDWLQDSRSALLVDLDNDGRQDLAVAIFGSLLLARNEGSRFSIQAVLPTSESTTSLSAADYDRDGQLDLYLCAYSPDRTIDSDPQALGPLGARFVFHDAKNGSPNTLFRNEIEQGKAWRFTDVTAATGLDASNSRWTFAASWEDFDNDGDPDLYLANDYGRNCLFQNNPGPAGGALFLNVAPAAGAEDSASGMSSAWADYDRDGWMDLYIGNMFSAAGSRVTSHTQFKPAIPADLRIKFQHFARGNTLLRNLGGSGSPGFADTSVVAGVTIGRWAWSSLFADLNNDGWEDLLVANGYITGQDGGDL